MPRWGVMIFGVALGASVTACRLARLNDSGSDVTNVIGRDDRVEMRSERYPWSAIGRLRYARFDGGTGHCTAFLVWRDIALTNAHCFRDEATGRAHTGHTFEIGRSDRDAIAVVSATRIGSGTAGRRGNDFALLRLSESVGDQLGWLPLVTSEEARAYARSTANMNPPGNAARRVFPGMTLAGYSADWGLGRVASVHRECALRGVVGGAIAHDCDETPGASGSPIFLWREGMTGGARVFAINAGYRPPDESRYPDGTDVPGVEYSEEIANLASRLAEVSASVNAEIARRGASNSASPRLEDVIKARGVSLDPTDATPPLAGPRRSPMP